MTRRVIAPAEQAKIARGFLKFDGSLREWARRNGVAHVTVSNYIRKLEQGHYKDVGDSDAPEPVARAV